MGIVEGLLRAERDSNVSATVIYGKGRTFPAGADITEFEAKRNSKGRFIKLFINTEY